MVSIITLICFTLLFIVWYIGEEKRKRFLKKVSKILPRIVIFGLLMIALFWVFNTKSGSSNPWITGVLLSIVCVSIILDQKQEDDLNAVFLRILMFSLMAPVLLVLFMNASFGNLGHVGQLSDWIDFWGSYIGSGIGVLGAIFISLWTTRTQLKESKKNDFENQLRLADLKQLGVALSILRIYDDDLQHIEHDLINADYSESGNELWSNPSDAKVKEKDLVKVVLEFKDKEIKFRKEFTSTITTLDLNNGDVKNILKKLTDVDGLYTSFCIKYSDKLTSQLKVDLTEKFNEYKNGYDALNTLVLEYYSKTRNFKDI